MVKKRYSKEFRIQAVSMSIEKGYSLKFIASELGLTDTKQVRTWIRRYKAEGMEGLSDRVPKMKESTRQQRSKDRELEGLRAENAILKYLLKIKKKEDMKRSKH